MADNASGIRTRDVVVHLRGKPAGHAFDNGSAFADGFFAAGACTGKCVVLRVPEGERVTVCEYSDAHVHRLCPVDGDCLGTGDTLYGVTLTPEVLAAVRAMCPVGPWETLGPRAVTSEPVAVAMPPTLTPGAWTPETD